MIEQLLARQTALKLKRGDMERRIRDLGSLPAEAYGDAFRGKSPKQLQRALRQATDRLKQFGWAGRAHMTALRSFPKRTTTDLPPHILASSIPPHQVVLTCCAHLMWRCYTYRAVNKKALDQHINFSEQRDELVRRRDESRTAEAKIQQLITTLDMRKDEAIERTFKVGLLEQH